MKVMVRCLALVMVVAACESRMTGDREKAAHPPAAEPAARHLPRFTPEGALVRPEGWESWVLAGTSMGLTYTESATAPAAGEPPGDFLNVYLQPWAYARFMETGEFPEGTMFALVGSDPVERTDPARGGFTQGAMSLLEVHLKRKGLHESGWGFYGFGDGEETAELIPGDAACYSCHRDEAAFDNAFVQFYPAMRERLGLEPAGEPAATDSTGVVS
jgi:hypothetical protein